jgi:hypothetical protein
MCPSKNKEADLRVIKYETLVNTLSIIGLIIYESSASDVTKDDAICKRVLCLKRFGQVRKFVLLIILYYDKCQM